MVSFGSFSVASSSWFLFLLLCPWPSPCYARVDSVLNIIPPSTLLPEVGQGLISASLVQILLPLISLQVNVFSYFAFCLFICPRGVKGLHKSYIVCMFSVQ